MRLVQGEGTGVALFGKAVYHRSAGVGQTHHLGAFVEGFACRVVDGLSYDFHFVIGLYTDDLRVSARYEQTKEWKLGRVVGAAGVLYEVGQYVCL